MRLERGEGVAIILVVIERYRMLGERRQLLWRLCIRRCGRLIRYRVRLLRLCRRQRLHHLKRLLFLCRRRPTGRAHVC